MSKKKYKHKKKKRNSQIDGCKNESFLKGDDCFDDCFEGIESIVDEDILKEEKTDNVFDDTVKSFESNSETENAVEEVEANNENDNETKNTGNSNSTEHYYEENVPVCFQQNQEDDNQGISETDMEENIEFLDHVFENEKIDYSIRAKITRKNKNIIVLFTAILLLSLLTFCIYEYLLVYSSASVEAGVGVSVDDFLRYSDDKAYFTDKSEKIDTSVPGSYNLKIMTGGLPHNSTLIVKDTIPPKVKLKKLTANYNEPFDAEKFVVETIDATEIEIEYVETPDFTQVGDQEIKIRVKDLGDNIVNVSTVMTIIPIRKEITLEVGSKHPEVSDFLLAGNDAEFITDIGNIDMSKTGITNVVVKVNGINYDSRLILQDTTPPELIVKNIDGFTNVKYMAEDFVDDCKDYSDVTYSYESKPDYSLVGLQDVIIVAEDASGNTTSKNVQLTLQEDTDVPVIEGAKDLEVFVGESVAYKNGVKVTDSCTYNLKLEVDSRQVNINKPGIYPVIYTGIDASGHSSSVTVNITVREMVYDLNTLNALVDRALGSCINPNMTNRQKCESIYRYIHNTVTYISTSVKGDYIKSAYDGLTLKKGDCYVYFSLAKAMLTRAGIVNMDIERIPEGNKLHYWNIVDLGDGHGWYHFDTTPRVGRPNLCLLDDATITAYSLAHDNCHNYDRSRYPLIP